MSSVHTCFLHTQNFIPVSINSIPVCTPSNLFNAAMSAPGLVVDPPHPSLSSVFKLRLVCIVSAFPDRGLPLPARILGQFSGYLFPRAPPQLLFFLEAFRRVDQACKVAEASLSSHVDSTWWVRSVLPNSSLYIALLIFRGASLLGS